MNTTDSSTVALTMMVPDYPQNGPLARGLLFFYMAVSSGQRAVGIWEKEFWA